LLQGIRDRVGQSVRVLYHEGCKITIGGSWQQDDVTPSNPDQDRKSIAEAVKVAQQADVVVLAIGDNEQTSREAWMLNHLGDRASLDLVGLQDELIDALAATGKPILAVLFNGRPISIRNLTVKATTIFECSIPAVNYPSPYPVLSATVPPTTTTSPPPGADTCSTM
jgi:beta-glucosidase